MIAPGRDDADLLPSEHRLAGTRWAARLRTRTGVIHWYVAHQLEHGGPASAAWCDNRVENRSELKTPIAELRADLAVGQPCGICTVQWPLPDGRRSQ